MDNIEELLMEKTSEIENIKAPDCLEEKLRGTLNKRRPKGTKAWKIVAVAASIALVIGFSLGFVNFSKKSDSNANTSMMMAAAKGPNNANYSLAQKSKSYGDAAVTTKEAAGGQNGPLFASANTPANSSPLQNISTKKIIKNANVTMETQKADDTFDKIIKWVNSNGGYEFSRNISVSGVNKQVEAVFKINPDKLYSMLDFLKSVGNVTNSQTTSSDITDQYIDSAARLKSLKAGRTQMMEVMKKATTIDDILMVQNELNTITAEIESLQGTINMWDKQLAESSVTLLIHEEGNPLLTKEKVDWKFNSPSEVFMSMKNGFIKSVNNLFNAIMWVLVFIISFLPIILVVGIAAFFIWRYIRKRKERNV
jgi:hypothetical protein